MRIFFLSDATRIITSEGQGYKRTAYLLDHNVTAAVVSTSTVFSCANTITVYERNMDVPRSLQS